MAKVFSKEQLNKIINDYISGLKDRIRVDKAILYGSYAKGNANELSDIDLLIISEDLSNNTPKGKNGYLLDKMVGDFNTDLEVIAINPSQLNNPIEKDFFEEILRTGYVMYPNKT